MEVMTWDPSTRSTGFSYFIKGRCAFLTRIKAPNLEDMLRQLRDFDVVDLNMVPDVAVVERPQIYNVTRSKSPPNKIVQVAIVAGACAQASQARELLMPHPKEWNGGVPKRVTEARVRKELEPQWDEIQKMLDRHKKQDDMIDALGLQVWAHARLRLALAR